MVSLKPARKARPLHGRLAFPVRSTVLLMDSGGTAEAGPPASPREAGGPSRHPCAPNGPKAYLRFIPSAMREKLAAVVESV